MTATRSERDWLDSVRASVMRGDLEAAQAVLSRALAEYPASADLKRAQAGLFQRTGHAASAEQILHDLLARHPGDTASAFALVSMLKEQSRTTDAAKVLRDCLTIEQNVRNPDLAITAVELLDDIDRKHDASAIAESAIAANPGDPRLHAYAGMLAIQLGEFDRARAHYLFALQHDARAFEWHVPIGLSSTLRYDNADHPDFALFDEGLKRENLSDLARAELHFSLAKAHDDIGDYAGAALHYAEGNSIRKSLANWSRKAWRRMVETRLAAKPLAVTAASTEGFTPVFIVGMLRSGTTLLSQLLARYPQVCNRGELTELVGLAQRLLLDDAPDRTALQRAASEYARSSRRDDAPGAHWFIDKQPLNLRYVDLMLAMFPDARIIHCRRNPRDNALSLWAQCFLERAHDYAYDFDDMSLVMRDGERLMKNWSRLYPDSIRSMHYEDLVANPDAAVAELARWIGMPELPLDTPDTVKRAGDVISTASLWQARQPVHLRSVERWKHYAAYIPELSKLPSR